MTNPKHHDFKRQEKWIRTNENWYPSYPPKQECVRQQYNSWHINPLDHKALRVSLIYLTNRTWRVCVWGADDFGMDFDQPSRMVAKEMFARIKDFTTEKQLKEWGFVRA